MRLIVKEIIRETVDWIMSGDSDTIREDLDSISLDLWDDLDYQEKLATLSYIYENTEGEDFTHSECCEPVSQAACAFCIEFFKKQDLLDILMEDMDFTMWSLHTNQRD